MRRDLGLQKVLTRRASILTGCQAGLLLLLAGRLYDLQVVQSNEYKLLADENRINLRLLPPRRGRILDRFGVEIATNRLNYMVVLVPEDTNNVEETLDALSELISISSHERGKVLREVMRNRSFVPVMAAENLTWEEFAKVNVHSPDLPGIHPEVGELRHYGLGEAFGHVVGYVAAVAEEELNGDPLLELPGFRVGKSGVEKTYDLKLRGTAGNRRVEVNAYGRIIRELARNEGKPGVDTVLTIDSDLQSMAYKRLSGESGSIVVIDVHTGDVLALVSTPGFDPNAFNIGLDQETWHTLLNDVKAPLINKGISGQYPPGSTFKMIVGLAALETGMVSPNHSVQCKGSVRLGNHEFYCWREGGHGHVGFVDAFVRSCDSFFYDVALRTGVTRIAEMANRFGLGSVSNIELPSERAGLIPTKEWKQAVRGEPWQKGETLVTGIGQGYVLATPLQLATMTAQIANGGHKVQPHVVRATSLDDTDTQGQVNDATHLSNQNGESLGLSVQALELIRIGMEGVTSKSTGTAFRARIEDARYAMAGKTGTSQVRRITKRERLARIRKNEEKPWIERDHALFVGYAPKVAPRFAISVVVEHGGSGAKVASPIARDVLLKVQHLQLKRQRSRSGLQPIKLTDIG